MEAKSTDEMSTKELEQLLAKRKNTERNQREKARKEYEWQRDNIIKTLIKDATAISEEMERFKEFCHEEMNAQQEKLNEYGGIRSNSKGGFSITTSDGTLRVTRRRDTEPTWDERAKKAEELIKDFLHDTVKKRDIDLFDILIGFVERNQKGDLEYSKVFSLIRHRDKFTDDRWVEGLRLLEESFGNHLKGYAYEFKTKSEGDKWKSLTMNFSAV